MFVLKRGKAFSQRSARSQKKIDRQISKLYGPQKSDRERALRDLRQGKWHPSARTPAKRLPQRFAQPAQPAVSQLKGLSSADLTDKALENMDRVWGEYFKYNRFSTLARIEMMTDQQKIWTATATPDQLIEKAAMHYKGNPWYYH